MIINRRNLITGLVCLIAAPAIVKAGNMMPIKTPVLESDLERLWREIRAENHFGFGLAPLKDEGQLIKYDTSYPTRLRILGYDQYNRHVEGLIPSANSLMIGR